MPPNAPSAPSVTARKSLSFPTQHITKSWPSAAAFGVAAVLPPNFSAHVFALAGVLLNTVTSWPPFATRCPAMWTTLGFRRPWNGPDLMVEKGGGLVGNRLRLDLEGAP